MVAVRRRSGLLGSNLDADASNNLYVRAAESDNYVWDTNTLAWVKMTQPGAGGGGAVTIADGADVAQGAKADVAWVAGDGTVIALLKKIASGGGGGSGPVTIIDGGDVTLGALADAAITTDTTGTVNAKLRGLIKMLAAGTAHVVADTGSTTAVTGNVTVVQGTGTNLHVVVDSAPSTAVTNAGTFAVQATLAAETTKVIGTVNQGTSPWVVSGAVTLASTTLTATVNPAGCATVADNRLTVTTAGTRVQFPSVAAKSVAVTAETDNTAIVVVGAVTCVAALATRRGLPLSPGDTGIFAVANINELYLDSLVDTEGVTYVVLV